MTRQYTVHVALLYLGFYDDYENNVANTFYVQTCPNSRQTLKLLCRYDCKDFRETESTWIYWLNVCTEMLTFSTILPKMGKSLN